MDEQHLKYAVTQVLRSVREDGAQLVWLQDGRVNHALGISRAAERALARCRDSVVGMFDAKTGREDLEEQILFCARSVGNVG